MPMACPEMGNDGRQEMLRVGVGCRGGQSSGTGGLRALPWWDTWPNVVETPIRRPGGLNSYPVVGEIPIVRTYFEGDK